jgi:putative MATE family efflux protein
MTKSMTEGKPLHLILAFAVPMFFGMLFQQFYSMVDTIIVGKFLGLDQLAGVGATSSLNFMVIGFCNGLCSGFGVPIAQMFGAKRESEMRKFVANAAWLSVIFSILLTIVVVIACRPLLQLLGTPENIFEYSYLYILIIFCGIPCTILYNILAAIIRSMGDSRTPVVFLLISSIINIVLDIAFIIVFHMGVEGPALATVISQGISGVICLFYMRKKFQILKMTKDERKFRRFHALRLCMVGVPMGLQYSVTAIGTLIIQAAINSFGSLTVAGVTAAQKIGMFITCPYEALGATMAAYSSQNTGAGRMDRVEEGVKAASLCGFVVSGLLLILVVLSGKQMSLIFLNEANELVQNYAYQFMVVSAAGYSLLTLVNVVRFTIQGMGYSMLAIVAGVLEMIARALAGTVGVALAGYMGVCFANVLAWIFADVFLIPAFFYCKKKREG